MLSLQTYSCSRNWNRNSSLLYCYYRLLLQNIKDDCTIFCLCFFLKFIVSFDFFMFFFVVFFHKESWRPNSDKKVLLRRNLLLLANLHFWPEKWNTVLYSNLNLQNPKAQIVKNTKGLHNQFAKIEGLYN